MTFYPVQPDAPYPILHEAIADDFGDDLTDQAAAVAGRWSVGLGRGQLAARPRGLPLDTLICENWSAVPVGIEGQGEFLSSANNGILKKRPRDGRRRVRNNASFLPQLEDAPNACVIVATGSSGGTPGDQISRLKDAQANSDPSGGNAIFGILPAVCVAIIAKNRR